MAGLVPPARPKLLRRGEGPAIHVLFDGVNEKTWMPATSGAKTRFAL